jgi:low affinity Fe/Cu permease
MENAALFMDIAERFGVPVAFAVIMVLLLVWFASQHRSERGEWRQMMEYESRLTREAIESLRSGLGELAEAFAFIDGKLGGKRKLKK